MDSGRGYRGWMAALTVAITLTLVFLVVEKHLRIPTPSYWLARGQSAAVGATTQKQGILLTVDPGLAGNQQLPPIDQTPIERSFQSKFSSTSLLRCPPEPAANVVLQAPIVPLELKQLPLHASSSTIDYLMETMDRAFERPIRTASAARSTGPLGFSSPEGEFLRSSQPQSLLERSEVSMLAPASQTARIPRPTSLLDQLDELMRLVTPGVPTHLVGVEHKHSVAQGLRFNTTEAAAIAQWVLKTQTLLEQLITQHGLEHDAAAGELQSLAQLAAQAPAIGDTLVDHELASWINRTGYALERRVAVWNAVHGCLDGTTIGLLGPSSPELARKDLMQSLDAIEQRLGHTGDAENWKNYLLLDELAAWSGASHNEWQTGKTLALQVLSRIHYTRLSESQKRFLAQPEFEELAARLAVWGREPIDYRQLLTHLEQFEFEPTSRSNAILAGSIQSLRHSDRPGQRELAGVLNNHYRNANMRLSISGDLIQRFLPNGDHEIRPVRQRILGADTSGDSAVHTELKLQLIPDSNAWNIDLGVLGDMVSMTSSSKGPATFHNTSTAQINSHRYVRIDPQGYSVSSEPTGVNSQDYLRKMNTDFDGLPIIGDFVRLIVREQFEQKKGLAQRITRRLIAQEADAELDRRLEEGLSNAERELNNRLIGPLQKFSLNPMVVSMDTTAQRLTVRYRVANEEQMASFTPRPRAPSDALMSLQFHQSTINNAIDQIGLSGRTWTLPELYERIGEVFQQSSWEMPEDVPADITIRFDDLHPASIQLVDGRMRLSLRIAELSQPNRIHIERFMVTSTYIPVADGLHAELLRDGVVEIVSRHDRLPLRVIFAKIFVANPQIPLVAEAWASDPRAAGLAVSQVEIRDGWLSVAISEGTSQQAAAVAERARELKQR
ncbi:MAG: hypothetical protein R3C53_28035 [Pirellulaceae bacterium]